MTKKRKRRTNRERSKKRRRRARTKKSVGHKLRQLMMAFFASSLITLLVLLFTFSIGRMEGYSMMTTVNHGDVFLTARKAEINRFDLVYINVPGKQTRSVRRIIGIAGDTLTYLNDELIINNDGKPERYLTGRKSELEGTLLTEDFTLKEVTGREKIPENSFFVLGDNRQSSMDSRDYGFIDKKDILGKVEISLFPRLIKY